MKTARTLEGVAASIKTRPSRHKEVTPSKPTHVRLDDGTVMTLEFYWDTFRLRMEGKYQRRLWKERNRYD